MTERNKIYLKSRYPILVRVYNILFRRGKRPDTIDYRDIKVRWHKGIDCERLKDKMVH